MEFGLPTTTTQSVYQPYTATNYKTTQAVQNVDLGNILTTTEDYSASSYANIETPTYTTGETFTTSEYQTTPQPIQQPKHILQLIMKPLLQSQLLQIIQLQNTQHQYLK